jgi:hypothetical protein
VTTVALRWCRLSIEVQEFVRQLGHSERLAPAAFAARINADEMDLCDPAPLAMFGERLKRWSLFHPPP